MDEDTTEQIISDIAALRRDMDHALTEIDRLHALAAEDVKHIYAAIKRLKY